MTAKAPETHARLSASSAHRWMNCAGAPRMEHGLPDVDTEDNIEGRAAHLLASGILETIKLAIEAGDVSHINLGAALEQVNTIPVRLKSGDGAIVTVTPEMRNAVFEYISTVVETYNAAPEPKRLYVEQVVSLEALSPPEPMFGTGDAIIMAQGQVIVIDLKYGTGVVVEVTDNPQLKEYALAAMLSLPREGLLPWRDTRFRTIIVQPRAAHPDGAVRETEYDYFTLRDFGHLLVQRATAANAPNAPLTPGGWCRWCKAAAFCPALRDQTKAVAQSEFMEEPPVAYHAPGTGVAVIDGAEYVIEVPPARFGLPNPEHITMREALAVLDKAETIGTFIAAVQERVRRAILAGEEIPGWKMVAGRPVREWVSESQLDQWAMRPDSGIGPEELYEKKLRSPAQIEKVVGKKNLPTNLWVKVSKSLKLVRADDPRPAIAGSAQQEFAALPPTADSLTEEAKPETS